jgi:hypothetical protein
MISNIVGAIIGDCHYRNTSLTGRNSVDVVIANPYANDDPAFS